MHEVAGEQFEVGSLATFVVPVPVLRPAPAQRIKRTPTIGSNGSRTFQTVAVTDTAGVRRLKSG